MNKYNMKPPLCDDCGAEMEFLRIDEIKDLPIFGCRPCNEKRVEYEKMMLAGEMNYNKQIPQ